MTNNTIFLIDDLSGEACQRYQKLAALAQQKGARLVPFPGPFNNPAKATKVFFDMLDSSDAFMILPSRVLSHPGAMARIHARVGAGARLLVQPNPNDREICEELLAPYDISLTSYSFFPWQADPGSCKHPAISQVPRHPETFLDEQFLCGVDQVEVQQAYALVCGPRCQPVLKVGREFMVVDKQTDLRVPSAQAEFAFVAVCRLPQAGAGAVLTVSGGLFYDEYQGPFGHRFTGIAANQRLAENVLDFLLAPGPKVAPLNSPSPTEAERSS